MSLVSSSVTIDGSIINAMGKGGPAAQFLVPLGAIEQPGQDHRNDHDHDENAQNGAQQFVGIHLSNLLCKTAARERTKHV